MVDDANNTETAFFEITQTQPLQFRPIKFADIRPGMGILQIMSLRELYYFTAGKHVEHAGEPQIAVSDLWPSEPDRETTNTEQPAPSKENDDDNTR